MGGEYITWFNSEGCEARKLLYKLEDIGIIQCDNIKQDNNWIKKEWVLTKKGQKIIDKDEELKEIWRTKKNKNVQRFYNKIMEIQKLKNTESQGGKEINEN